MNPQVKPVQKRPYLSRKERIFGMLEMKMSPRDIAKHLECEPNVVYYHINKGKETSKLPAKLARLNKQIKTLGFTVDREFVMEITKGKCAFSANSINLDTDEYHLAYLGGMLVLYLPEYQRLTKLGTQEHFARCRALLEFHGYTVTK